MRTWSVLTLFSLLVACDPSNYLSGSVGKAMRQEIREKKQKEVNLAKVVPFTWDELYLFTPYTPREAICKKLQISGLECRLVVLTESTADGEMFIVFRYKAKIVHTEMYGRFIGDFTPIDFTQPVTPQHAQFSVVQDGFSSNGETWLRLRPVSQNDGSNNSLNRTGAANTPLAGKLNR